VAAAIRAISPHWSYGASPLITSPEITVLGIKGLTSERIDELINPQKGENNDALPVHPV